MEYRRVPVDTRPHYLFVGMTTSAAHAFVVCFATCEHRLENRTGCGGRRRRPRAALKETGELVRSGQELGAP